MQTGGKETPSIAWLIYIINNIFAHWDKIQNQYSENFKSQNIADTSDLKSITS